MPFWRKKPDPFRVEKKTIADFVMSEEEVFKAIKDAAKARADRDGVDFSEVTHVVIRRVPHSWEHRVIYMQESVSAPVQPTTED